MSKRLNEASLKKAVSDAAAGRSYDVSDAGSPGLVLRVAPKGPTWAWRGTLDGKSLRLRLGSVDMLSLAVAREIAAAATSLVREQRQAPTEAWLRDQLMRRRVIEKPVEAPAVPELPPKVVTWTFSQAREHYLDEVRRTLRPATWTDRRGMLGIKELGHLVDRPVCLITRADIAAVIAEVFRSGRERHAGKIAEVVRPMWAWLAEEHQVGRSGVREGVMVGLKPPKPTNREGEEEQDQGTYLPLPSELGRALAMLRAGVVNDTMCDAALLMLFTSQRRRTVVTARRTDFVDEDGTLIWQIPPRFRKKGRGKRRSHDLPLPDEVAAMVRRRLSVVSESPWLFPATRPRRSGDAATHLNADSLTHLFSDLPGITMSPHDTRRGFTTYLEDILGLDQQVLKTVLDHSEGKASNDVTDAAYSKARRLTLKTTILTAWSGFLTKQPAAIELGDVEAIKQAITASRRERTRLSAKKPRPKRSRPGRYKPKPRAA